MPHPGCLVQDRQEISSTISTAACTQNEVLFDIDNAGEEEDLNRYDILNSRPARPITVGELGRRRETRLKQNGMYLQKMMKTYGIDPGDTWFVYNSLHMDPNAIKGYRDRKQEQELISLKQKNINLMDDNILYRGQVEAHYGRLDRLRENKSEINEG